MSQPYVGQITMFAGNFAPRNYAFCNGQTLSIAQNQALYTLIGTTYGGDGVQTFNLPDLRSRLPIHLTSGSVPTTYIIGQNGGTETVSLTSGQIPQHTHTLNATTNPASTTQISSNVLPGTVSSGGFLYETSSSGSPLPMVANACSLTGSNIPHSNLMPSLCISFVIALFGVFPQRS